MDDSQLLIQTALRVLGAYTHRRAVESVDVEYLRTHCDPAEERLYPDELARSIITRELLTKKRKAAGAS